MTDERKQLNVKIPVQLYTDLDSQEENKTDIVIRALEKELYGTDEASPKESKDYEKLIGILEEQVAFMQKQLIEKDSQIAKRDEHLKEQDTTTKMQLSQVQSLINESKQQREDFKLMLMPPVNDQTDTTAGGKKPWWRVWG